MANEIPLADSEASRFRDQTALYPHSLFPRGSALQIRVLHSSAALLLLLLLLLLF